MKWTRVLSLVALLALCAGTGLSGLIFYRAPAAPPAVEGMSSMLRGAPAPLEGPARTDPRLPLRMDSTTLPPPEGEERPLVRVLGLPHGAMGELHKEIRSGKRAFEPPREKAVTGLYLVGPSCNSGEGLWPVELRRRGKTFTLIVESWRDNLDRAENYISRPAHLLNLSASVPLEAGDYRLEVVLRDFFRSAEEGPCYRLRSVQRGVLPFRVLRAGEPAKGAEPELHLRGGLKAEKVNAAEARARWQRPWMGVVEKYWGNPKPCGLRGAGVLERDRSQRAELPTLNKPTPSSAVHALVLGPYLNRLEEVTLRSVSWQGRVATLRVEAWRSEEPVARNEPYTPILVVPLDLPRDKAGARHALPGDYTVRVEWVFLRAERLSGPYQVEAPPPARAPAWMKELRERSRATFTIPKS
jgi:hypothetical protein